MAKNEYRKEPLSEERNEEMQEAVEEKAEVTRNFLMTFFSSERFSSRAFVGHVPFIAFLGMLAIVYIANRHYAERSVREIDRLSKEVKEMSWDYKSLSAELMNSSTQSEIAKKVLPLGLEERTAPPRKILLKKPVKE